MPTLLNDGYRIHYQVHGPAGGAPVVLVHGYFVDYRLNWVASRWEDELAMHSRRVIGLDLRGHGQSDKPHLPSAYDRDVMATDVIRVLDEVGADRADYVGYSMGGRLGLEILAAHPDRFSRAVIGGIGNFTSDDQEKIARRMLGDSTPFDPESEAFYRFATLHDNDLKALGACMRGRLRSLDDPDFLSSIRVPMLILVGDQDTRVTAARQVAGRIPGAEFMTIAGRNHFNAYLSRQFKDATFQFLAISAPDA